MSSQLRMRLVLALLAVCVDWGCRFVQPAPVSQASLVGDYVYESMLQDEVHRSDRLVLSADGTYILTQGGEGQPQHEQKGVWRLYAGDPPNVLLDHAGYPVEVRGKEIRLLIDLDIGQWYKKVR